MRRSNILLFSYVVSLYLQSNIIPMLFLKETKVHCLKLSPMIKFLKIKKYTFLSMLSTSIEQILTITTHMQKKNEDHRKLAERKRRGVEEKIHHNEDGM